MIFQLIYNNKFLKINKIMETKKMTITPPDGYEIDEEKSTLSEIVFKKIEKEVKVWEDIDEINGTYIDEYSNFVNINSEIIDNKNKNIFIDDRHAKAALAMAQISQLIPYYGGEITSTEWKELQSKYCILNVCGVLSFERINAWQNLLSFHTNEQRAEFYKINKQLVHDYLMIED